MQQPLPQPPANRPTYSPSPRGAPRGAPQARVQLTRVGILKRQQYVVKALLTHSIKKENWEEVEDLTKKLHSIDSLIVAEGDIGGDTE